MSPNIIHPISIFAYRVYKNDVANKTERRLKLDRDLGLWLRQRQRPEIEDEALVFACHLGLYTLHCGVYYVCVRVCKYVWCECYGNLLSSAYTKLETRKALGNLHESCPQTALPAVSCVLTEREGERGGLWWRIVGHMWSFFLIFTPKQHSAKAYKRLLLIVGGGHMWQLYWILIHTQKLF